MYGYPRGRLSAVFTLVLTFALVALVLGLQGCSQEQQDPGESADRRSGEASSAVEPTDTVEGDSMDTAGGTTAVIKTNKGDITITFYPEDAPKTVESFVKLSTDGFYDGIRFHRVEPGFVVQGGDPLTKGLSAEQVREIIARQSSGRYQPDDPALGTGGPGFNLKAEFNSRKHLEGTVAMARSQSPDSAGSQFYICLGPQPFLDGKYTVFGQVTDGMDVVKAIEVGDEITSIAIAE